MPEAIIGFVASSIAVWIVTIAIGTAACRAVESGWIRLLIIALCVTLPPLVILLWPKVEDANRKSQHARERELFTSFCTGRKLVVHKQPAVAQSTVALERANLSINRLYLHTLSHNPEVFVRLCKSSEVAFVEGEEYGKTTRIEVCTRRETRHETMTLAYALRIGAPSEIARNTVFPAREFSKVPIVLVDVPSGEVLAEDTLFFLGPSSSGNPGCPDAGVQLLEMLEAVFPKIDTIK